MPTRDEASERSASGLNRRELLKRSGVSTGLVVTGLAGCLGSGDGGDGSDGGDGGDGGGDEPATTAEKTEELPEVTYRFGSAFAESVECLDCVTAQAESDFGKRVAEQTNGKVTQQLHSGTELCAEVGCLERAMDGVLSMAQCTLTNSTAFIPSNEVWVLPYTFPTPESIAYTFTKPETFERHWIPMAQEHGVLPMWWAAPFYRSVFLGKDANIPDRPSTPNDIAGLDIRRTKSEASSKSVEAWGATPVDVGYGDLIQGLNSGVIDGYETGPGGLLALGDVLVELTQAVIVNNFMLETGVKWANVEWLTSLPDQYIQTMADVSRNIFEETINTLPEIIDQRWGLTESPHEDSKVAEFGIDVVVPNEDEMSQWRDPIDPEQNPDMWTEVIERGESLGGDGFYQYIRDSAREDAVPEPGQFEVEAWWDDYIDEL